MTKKPRANPLWWFLRCSRCVGERSIELMKVAVAGSIRTFAIRAMKEEERKDRPRSRRGSPTESYEKECPVMVEDYDADAAAGCGPMAALSTCLSFLVQACADASLSGAAHTSTAMVGLHRENGSAGLPWGSWEEGRRIFTTWTGNACLVLRRQRRSLLLGVIDVYVWASSLFKRTYF